ncbi:MAG TPA: NAD(P)/FAD-dependent oxidoreductase [Acidimicrobiales bacterium]|nr:NAD(P)/FAD-dependent oxidoreductase [Acidimicrobiales bacterium]
MIECDVLVVGGGFGGAYAARELERRMGHRAERVVLVAPENFLLFSPLLAEAASGTLEPRHAVVPLRPMLKRVHVITGSIDSIDIDEHAAVAVDHAGVRHDLHYAAIVLSPGSVPSTLPIPGLAEEAVGFKTLPDAIWLRNRVLAQLEAASDLPDDDLRRELLTFTFVGGGYAGVEALAELESLTRDALRMYPRLRAVDLRWVLIEARDTLLPNLSARLSSYTLRHLRSRGVEVMLETRLTSCVDKLVETEGAVSKTFRTGTLVWTAGQRPSSFVSALGLPMTKEGRVITDQYLEVPDHPGVFAVGDAAAVPAAEGGMSPQTAQHAFRQGIVAGRNAAAWLGHGEREVFDYHDRGLAVTLGKWQGVCEVKGYTFKGFLAWWMGRSYHLLMIPGLARKTRVVTDWTIALLFPRDIAQLGALGKPTPLP